MGLEITNLSAEVPQRTLCLIQRDKLLESGLTAFDSLTSESLYLKQITMTNTIQNINSEKLTKIGLILSIVGFATLLITVYSQTLNNY